MPALRSKTRRRGWLRSSRSASLLSSTADVNLSPQRRKGNAKENGTARCGEPRQTVAIGSASFHLFDRKRHKDHRRPTDPPSTYSFSFAFLCFPLLSFAFLCVPFAVRSGG